eukprot:1140741-Pelagomonas_calceolata.AAC.3
MEDFSTLDVSAKDRRPSVPNDEVCWCAGSDCKSMGKARVYGCPDNVERLTWGSIGGVKVIKINSEVTFKVMH